MNHAARQILMGFVTACLLASYLSLLMQRDGGGAAMSGLIPRLVSNASHIAVWALPGAMISIIAGERLRIRAITFYMAAGAVTALLGAVIKSGAIVPSTLGISGPGWSIPVLTMGVLAGIVYWGIRGQRAGTGTDVLGVLIPGPAVDPRCRACAIAAFAAATAPLCIAGCWSLHNDSVIARITRDAEQSVTLGLAQSGFGWASIRIDDAVGRVVGTAESETQRRLAVDRARELLKPMTGIPGLISLVEDATTSTAFQSKPAVP